jgi:alpha-L-fucosidase
VSRTALLFRASSNQPLNFSMPLLSRSLVGVAALAVSAGLPPSVSSAAAETAPLQDQGFNEGKGKAFTAEDVRFTTKNGVVYAFVMGAPKTAVHIKSLGSDAKLLNAKITRVSRLGSSEKFVWSQSAEALTTESPRAPVSNIATVFEISSQ